MFDSIVSLFIIINIIVSFSFAKGIFEILLVTVFWYRLTSSLVMGIFLAWVLLIQKF